MSDEKQPTAEFWADLRRHPVFQGAALFGGGSWLALQAADVFGLETSTVRLLGATLLVVFLGLVGYAVIMVVRQRGGHAVIRQGPRPRYVVAGTVTLLLLGTGAWIARPHLLKSAVREGADVIAVLPFQASGAGVDLFGEGLVDLLSTNLDEVGAIRTVNPRTMLHQYRQHAAGGSVDLDGALRVGRAVGAGSVLLGSVVSVGGEARITAELHEVEGGTVIARAQKSGPADNILALVDELSVELMRDIWRSREPLPELRVSAITTPSVAAIRAYMRGEQHYRRVQWDSARVAFSEAVAHDSMFALAHFRLAETYGWSESLGSGDARRHSEAAARFADRLPARERALVLAHLLHEAGDVAAIDSFRAYTARYPDDATGWYMLADARFHGAAALGLDLPTLLEGFERVLELDPTYAQPFAHLLEVTFLLGDSLKYDRYLARYGTMVDTAATRIYHTLRTVRWAHRAEALAAVEDALRAGAATPNGVLERITIATTARAYGDTPDVDFFSDVTVIMARALRDVPGVALQMDALRAGVLASAGRYREADALLASLRRQNGEQALSSALPFITSGAAPDYAFGAERALLAAAPARRGAAYWRSIQALSAGEAAAAARELDVVRRDTASVGLPVSAQTLAALDGWLDVVRGDTTGGMRRMRAAALDAGYAPMNRSPAAPVRGQLALLQARSADPQVREEGINRLELAALMDVGIGPLLYLPLAEAWRAHGNVERAAFWYSRFLALWQNADPELQPQIEHARGELQRLAQERRPS